MSAEKILAKIVRAVRSLPEDNRATLIQFAPEDERENFSLTDGLVVRVKNAADVLALLAEIQDTDLGLLHKILTLPPAADRGHQDLL